MYTLHGHLRKFFLSFGDEMLEMDLFWDVIIRQSYVLLRIGWYRFGWDGHWFPSENINFPMIVETDFVKGNH